MTQLDRRSSPRSRTPLYAILETTPSFLLEDRSSKFSMCVNLSEYGMRAHAMMVSGIRWIGRRCRLCSIRCRDCSVSISRKWIRESICLPCRQSLTSLQSLSFGFRAGALIGLGGKPTLFSDRYQLGGPTSVRIFRPNTMGPKDSGESPPSTSQTPH